MGLLDGFIAGFEKGQSSQDDHAYKQLRDKGLRMKLHPEMEQLNKEFLRARIAHLGRSGADRDAEGRGLRNELTRLHIQALKEQMNPTDSSDAYDAGPSYTPLDKPAGGAIPTDTAPATPGKQSMAEPEDDEDDEDEDDTTQAPTRTAGAIPTDTG